jgi:hypothetical protein
MMAHLKVLLYEEDPDKFHGLTEGFKTRFAGQDIFMEYFDRNWCGKEKFNIWSRAYHPLEFSYMHVVGICACKMQGALVFCKENTNEFQSVF